jgi:hypothetical protein
MNNVKVHDQFFETRLYFELVKYLYNVKKYAFGEFDHSYAPPVGLIADFTDALEFPLSTAVSKIQKLIPDNLNLDRIYCNCFAPNEFPYFHIDSSLPQEKTVLVYISDKEWSINDGGETQFYQDDRIFGVPPRQNRLIIFDSNILHRATSFHNRHRFTLALKYKT